MRKKRSFKRFLKYLYFKLIRINDPPEKIAKSFAIGVFIGIFPTFGLGGLMAIIISRILKLNYISTILGTFVMNYITSPIFWSISYFLGDFIIEGKINFRFIERGKIKQFAFKYLLGNVIVSLVFSILSYYIVKTFIKKYRERKLRKTVS
jgi:uncharacterized protein (DUF2062 family)